MTQYTVSKIAKLLNQKQCVAIPTETVYGMAARIDSDEAICRVFELKQRPKDHPLIVHIANTSQLLDLACYLPHYVHKLIKHFWPGPLTMVFPVLKTVNPLITAGQTTIAVRMPNHPLTLKLINKLGCPVVAPSANPYGYISPTTAQHVQVMFGDDFPVLDGGECSVGIESTIISMVSNDEITIMRPGIITAEDIEKIAGVPCHYVKPNDKQAIKVSGSCNKHYAPKHPIVLHHAKRKLPNLKLKRIAYLSLGLSDSLNPIIIINMSNNPVDYAKQLFAALQKVDHADIDIIVIDQPPDTKEWLAIHDRLNRAAAH